MNCVLYHYKCFLQVASYNTFYYPSHNVFELIFPPWYPLLWICFADFTETLQDEVPISITTI